MILATSTSASPSVILASITLMDATNAYPPPIAAPAYPTTLSTQPTPATVLPDILSVDFVLPSRDASLPPPELEDPSTALPVIPPSTTKSTVLTTVSAHQPTTSIRTAIAWVNAVILYSLLTRPVMMAIL